MLIPMALIHIVEIVIDHYYVAFFRHTTHFSIKYPLIKRLYFILATSTGSTKMNDRDWRHPGVVGMAT